MKSSANTPGAIWRLPRLDVGLLIAVGVMEMSAFGDEVPPKGECHVGSDILRPAEADENWSSICSGANIGPGMLESSGAISSLITFSVDFTREWCSFTAFSIAPRSAELAAERSVLDERSLS